MTTVSGTGLKLSPNASAAVSTAADTLQIDPRIANTKHIETNILDGNIVHVVLKDSVIEGEELCNAIGVDLFQLFEEVKNSGYKGVKFVVDYQRVTENSSVLIGKLITLDKKLKEDKVSNKLTLCGLTPALAEIFYITKLNNLFDIKNNIDAVLASRGK